MRAILGLVLAFSVGAGCGGGLPGPDADGAAKLASPEGWCSAVPVGRRLVATAGHCVELVTDPDHEIDVPEQGVYHAVGVTEFGRDGALLTVDRDLETWVDAWGAPTGVVTYVSAHGVLHTCEVLGYPQPTWVQTRCDIAPRVGDSGSPFFDAEGRVWGVFSSFDGHLAYAVPLYAAVADATSAR